MRGKKPARSFEPFPMSALGVPSSEVPLLAAIVPFPKRATPSRLEIPSGEGGNSVGGNSPASLSIDAIKARLNELLEQDATSEDERLLIAKEITELAREAERKGGGLTICYVPPQIRQQ